MSSSSQTNISTPSFPQGIRFQCPPRGHHTSSLFTLTSNLPFQPAPSWREPLFVPHGQFRTYWLSLWSCRRSRLRGPEGQEPMGRNPLALLLNPFGFRLPAGQISSPFYSPSQIRSRRLYLTVRSPRQGAPAFRNSAPSATARSVIKASSVSPDRWEAITCIPASRAARAGLSWPKGQFTFKGAVERSETGGLAKGHIFEPICHRHHKPI